MCCVEGDAGAPLSKEEVNILEKEIENINPYLTEEGKEVITQNGISTTDKDGDFVTPLVKNKQCAFATYTNEGIVSCGIEQAWKAGKTGFRKPISCHLYPIRINQLKEYLALNYHQWDICSPAIKCGLRSQTKIYEFLKDALIRRFGEQWYAELEITAREWLKHKD